MERNTETVRPQSCPETIKPDELRQLFYGNIRAVFTLLIHNVAPSLPTATPRPWRRKVSGFLRFGGHFAQAGARRHRRC